MFFGCYRDFAMPSLFDYVLCMQLYFCCSLAEQTFSNYYVFAYESVAVYFCYITKWDDLGWFLDYIYIYIYIYTHTELYYPTASYKITYSIATLSYDNCYANLRDYSNSLLCDLL
jgi:hypothetical protein